MPGDTTTKGNKVFPFFLDRACNGFQEVLSRYTEITPQVQLSGPSELPLCGSEFVANFAPIIMEAINIVKQHRDVSAHTKADQQVPRPVDHCRRTGRQRERFALASSLCHPKETRDAIVMASEYPLSIVVVGVGGTEGLFNP